MDGAEQGQSVNEVSFDVSFGAWFILMSVVAGWSPKFSGKPFSLRWMMVMERWMMVIYVGINVARYAASEPRPSVEMLDEWWPCAVMSVAFWPAQRLVRKIAEKFVAMADRKPRAFAGLSAWLKGADIADEETLRLRASVPSAEEQLDASNTAIMAAQGLSEARNAGEGELAIVEGDG